ncbi:unnamed protein product [Pylaiella littoralis]
MDVFIQVPVSCNLAAPPMCRRYLHSDSRGMLADLYNPRQDEDLACYYGLKKSFSGRSTTWVLSRSSLARERADAQWSFCRQDGRRSTVLTAHGNSRLARVERPSRTFSK